MLVITFSIMIVKKINGLSLHAEIGTVLARVLYLN